MNTDRIHKVIDKMAVHPDFNTTLEDNILHTLDVIGAGGNLIGVRLTTEIRPGWSVTRITGYQVVAEAAGVLGITTFGTDGLATRDSHLHDVR